MDAIGAGGELWEQADPGFFLSLVENSPDPIATVDDSGTILFASSAFERVLGYDPESLSGRSLTALISEEVPTEQYVALERRLTTPGGLESLEEGCSLELRHESGETVPVSVRFHAHEYEGDQVYTGVFGRRPDRSAGGCLAETFENAVEHAGHAIYVTDTEGTIEYVNPAFTETTGYEPAAAIGETPRILNSGEMSEEYFESLWETLESGEVWDEEITNRRKSGELYHARQTIAPVYDDGELANFVAIQTDISDRKASERELEQHREVLERLDDPIMLQSCDGRFELINDAVAGYAGRSREELVGTDEFAFMDDAAAKAIDERKMEVLETEQPIEYEITPRFREMGWEGTFSTKRYPYYDQDGALAGTIAICREVTDLKRREEKLRQYKRAIEGATDLISASDREGRYLFANPQYCAYHGLDPKSVEGRELSSVFDDRAFAEIQRHKERALEGETVRYRTVRTHPTKGERILDVRYYPLENEESGSEIGGPRPESGEGISDDGETDPVDGETEEEATIVGVVAVLRDVTDREERARQLRVVDRVLRHNLRNELTVIRGRAEQIADRAAESAAANPDGASENGPSDEDDRRQWPLEAAREIITHADGLLRTGEKSRRITRVLSEPPDQRSIDLTRPVERLAGKIEKNGHDARIDVTVPEAAIVRATTDLDAAIEELLENALEHSDRDRPTVEVDVSADDDTVRVRIADDGPGMSPMDQDVLQTGRPPEDLYHGSGLGLWLVYWIVNRSGGSIDVRSREPRGTEVVVDLPRDR